MGHMTYKHNCLVVTGHVQFLKPEYNTVRSHFVMTGKRKLRNGSLWTPLTLTHDMSLHTMKLSSQLSFYNF